MTDSSHDYTKTSPPALEAPLADNDTDDRSSNPSSAPRFRDVGALFLSRRQTLGLGLATLASSLVPSLASEPVSSGGNTFGFSPLSWRNDDQLVVPSGHSWQRLISWGDPVTRGAPQFDFNNQSSAAQTQQAGFNHDFVGYCPLPRGSSNSQHGLLCISFEYTDPAMMYPELMNGTMRWNKELIARDLAAHGLAVIEIKQDSSGNWSYDQESALNRRVTGRTPIAISGPAAGHPLLCTDDDPTGRLVLGTLNNCAGGITPWGTWLQAEENFNQYFALENPQKLEHTVSQQTLQMYRRYGIRSRNGRSYHLADRRFSLDQTPHESHRFGWIVETDPYDPSKPPIKRTSLGRFKHEAATVHLAKSGQPVVYMGDDQADEYIYKFVAKNIVNTEDDLANANILDEGILYVARLDSDGRGEWLPLVYNHGPLTKENGFPDQATILTFTRRAADLLGATPMDRPEDVEASPVTGKVYVALTNNGGRTSADAANPRAPNFDGHIVEIHETDDDHTSTSFTWDLLLVAGPPSRGAVYGQTGQGSDGNNVSPLSCPDNLSFLSDGSLIIATDGQIKTVGANDGLYFVPVSGPKRGQPQQFLSGLPGGEVCGPCLTPDGTTLFCAIQHPGADNPGRENTCLDPGSRFPDYDENLPPRPTVIAVRRDDQGVIGAT